MKIKELYFICLLITLAVLMTACGQLDTPDVPDTPDEPALPIVDTVEYETQGGLKTAPVYDLGGIYSEKLNYEKIESYMRIISKMGYERIYFVVLNDGYPSFSSPRSIDTEGSNGAISITDLGGDVNAAFVKVAKEHGLTPYAIYKPYENGGFISAPVGYTPEDGVWYETTVGGNRAYFESFVEEHPEMRVSRIDDYDEFDYKATVDKIELAFLCDTVYDTVNGQKKATSSETQLKREFRLWVSKDNGTYEPYEGDYSFEWTLEKRNLTDCNGFEYYEGFTKKVSVLTITGLNITEEYQYVAVTFDAKTAYIIPPSMIKMYSDGVELKTTATHRIRNMIQNSDESFSAFKQDTAISASDLKVTVNNDGSLKLISGNGAENFAKWGFEFNFHSGATNGAGYVMNNCYGIARGRTEYLQGTLCEGYEEVREYWLSFVEHLVDIGFEGIDIRLAAHCSNAIDYAKYGYNEPIVERYKELYGEYPSADNITEEIFLRIMKIRGEFFTLFLEEAGTLCGEKGVVLGMELLEFDLNPQVSAYWFELCHWTMPKISVDWKKCVDIADEIVIKSSFYGSDAYSYEKIADILEYAEAQDKKVWVTAYAGDDNWTAEFEAAVASAGKVYGLQMYEVWFNSSRLGLLRQFNSTAGYEPVEK